jgi:hypothetical protein
MLDSQVIKGIATTRSPDFLNAQSAGKLTTTLKVAFFGMKEFRSCSLQDELFDRFGKAFFVHSSSDVSG